MNGTSRWSGKHALVTGGTAGLGRHFAHACAARDMVVTLVARDEMRLNSEADRLRTLEPNASIHTLVTDLAEAGAASEAAKLTSDRQPVDMVCHCAGKSARGRLAETSRSDFESLLKINFLAAAELATALGSQLAKRQGHMVLIGSLASRVAPAYLGAYPTSKHPLSALAQQLRLELGPEGLHTLLVCPGPITRDDSGQRYNKQAADLPEEAKQPGGGAKLKTIDPKWLCEKIFSTCERRKPELIVPSKARILFTLTQMSASWGDWILSRSMGKK